MSSVNKVTLVGNLGRDPETNFGASGALVVNFSIATTSTWKDKASGERKEHTEWHRVKVFGNLATICAEHLKKGRQVYVEGEIRSSKYNDKDGVERTSYDIIANEVKFLGKRESDDGAPTGDGYAGE